MAPFSPRRRAADPCSVPSGTSAGVTGPWLAGRLYAAHRHSHIPAVGSSVGFCELSDFFKLACEARSAGTILEDLKTWTGRLPETWCCDQLLVAQGSISFDDW